MDRIFIRNFVVFIIILLICAGGLSYSLIKGDRELGKTDDLVLHTHNIISESEQLSTLIEGMLSAQRGYLLTHNESFIAEYDKKKDDISDRIASLAELVEGDKSQESRLAEIRNYFTEFTNTLEERSHMIEARTPTDILGDIRVIESIKDNIIRINNAVLYEEYGLLNERIQELERKKTQYFTTLFIGIIFGTILLLVLNGFLLRAQRKRTRVEASLKDTEQRFALAIDGTQDGIFDWDLKSDKVYYSRRFFGMLGYDTKATTGSVDALKELLHPEDAERVMEYIDQYLNGGLSEYAQEFRMRHESGRWVWIKSRAKALYDEKGKPYRMVGAHSDITHIVKAREKLQHEKEEAEKANQAKSDFLAHMSHEIRTPLTAISGIAEIFERSKDNLDDKQKRLVDTLLSSTCSLKDLIDDILDFSKIESGELELDESTFRLDEFFENVINMMCVRAPEKNIRFIFDYNDVKDLEFTCDQKRFRQILINLTGNAFKFTEKGEVRVKAYIEERENASFLRVDVTDTGIGIHPENFNLIFERFKQEDSSVSRRYGGTGLGLPISRNLAQLMGGELQVSSQPEKGSTFSLLLPVREAIDLSASEPFDARIEKLNDKIRASLTDKSKILMVEDYEGNIVMLSYVLEDLNINYDIARDGSEAVALWEKNHYDIILMDIQMPVMDGFSATKYIRQQEKIQKLERTPVIGMTAHALVGDKDKCIAAGMDTYLPKPIIESDLKREILKYLQEGREAA